MTVLCPVYNEELVLPHFHDRITRVFEQLPPGYIPSLVYLDNGSVDRTWEILSSICDRDPRVSMLVMSRNFGYQRSMEGGLRVVDGSDLYLFIDADCEDPPEMILELLQHHRDHDLVYGERVDRSESPLLVNGRKLFYRVAQLAADEPFIVDMGEFCLFSSAVRDAMMRERTSFPFVRASIARAGFRRKRIPYKRSPRVAGRTHFSPLGMFTFAAAGILSSSTLPLRAVAYLLPFWLAGLVVISITGVVSGAGWTVPVLLTLGFAYCGMALAAMALYVARMVRDLRHGTDVVVDWKRSRWSPPTDSTGSS